jgi:flagellar secretion chaperone FliS
MQSEYAQGNYLEQEILSANGVELVLILYRAALESLDQARTCLRRGDIAGRSKAISKAAAVLGELTGSVNRAQGGELAASLIELYDYMQRRLLEANIHQLEEPLAETGRLLGTLMEAWSQVPAAELAATPTAEPAPFPLSEPDLEYAGTPQSWSL